MPHQLSEAASTYVSSGLLASCKTVWYLTQAAALVNQKMVPEERKKNKKKIVERRGESGRGKRREKRERTSGRSETKE